MHSSVPEWTSAGWRVRIRTQEYSPNVKEPKLGANAGILVEIRHSAGGRVVKAAWLQAKRVDVLPVEPLRDAALDEQMQKMGTRTADAYPGRPTAYSPRSSPIAGCGNDPLHRVNRHRLASSPRTPTRTRSPMASSMSGRQLPENRRPVGAVRV
jgi:hypothetical protein